MTWCLPARACTLCSWSNPPFLAGMTRLAGSAGLALGGLPGAADHDVPVRGHWQPPVGALAAAGGRLGSSALLVVRHPGICLGSQAFGIGPAGCGPGRQPGDLVLV